MILEKGCAERGCACYDVRVDEGVEVKVVRELTDEEIRKVADEVFKKLQELALLPNRFCKGNTG